MRYGRVERRWRYTTKEMKIHSQEDARTAKEYRDVEKEMRTRSEGNRHT